MRTDHQGAISALKRAADLLRSPHTSSGDFSARLFDLTSILFEHPLCTAALEQVLTSRSARADAFERCRHSFVQSIKSDLKQFYSGVLKVVETVERTGAIIADKAEALRRAGEILGKEIKFGGASASVHVALQELTVDEHLDRLTSSKLEHVRTWVLSGGSDSLKPLANAHQLATNEAHSGLLFRQIENAREILKTRLAEGVRRLNFAEGLIGAASLEPVVAELRRGHQETRSLLQDSVLPASEHDRLDALSRLENFQVPTTRALLIAQLVEARLHLGVVENHSLNRLRVHLERFGKKQLLADFDSEESGGGNRLFEARLQERVDAFLFAEGLFPITHAEASGGPIDTFVAENQHVFHEVLQEHQIPVLLELKVAVRADATKAKVRAKLDTALEQADAYATHLRANPRWRDHRVTALVAYDGPKRFRTRREGVLLAYLGPAKPHEGATLLEDA